MTTATNNHADLKYWVAFSRVPGLGSVRIGRLESHFGSLENAWKASKGDFRAAGMDSKTMESVAAGRVEIDPDAEIERMAEAGIYGVTWNDPRYPPRLKETSDPPPVLFLRGEISPTDEKAVAVVGTRKATAYGKDAAQSLTSELASQGVTIVSGMARGIDAVAHRAALDAGGRTIAVFGCGLDTVYPPEHRKLAEDIAQSGALVSEHPLGEGPKAGHFPQRNRIISGMSLGILVVEAPLQSGALWTVRHALDQNRDVFCVPGSIFSPSSKATNALIQEGAKLVSGCEDILEELNLNVVSHQLEMRQVLQPEDGVEADLLGHVGYEPVHIDEIRRIAQLPIAEVSSSLAMMELKGLVRQVGSMHYVRVREAIAQHAS